jgi:transposase InsO family protein
MRFVFRRRLRSAQERRTNLISLWRPTIRFGARAAHQHRSIAVAEAGSLEEGLDSLLVVDDGICACPIRAPQAAIETPSIEDAGERIPNVGVRIRFPGEGAGAAHLDHRVLALRKVQHLRKVGPRLRRGRRLNRPFRRKRQEADVIAAPSGMLDRCAFVAANGATCTTPQLVARCVRPPRDHGDGARQRCMVLTLFAPHPYPRRRALQVAESWPRSRMLPLGSWPAATRQPSRHRSSIEVGRLPTRGDKASAVETKFLVNIPMARGFVYLAVVLDWFSRRVLSWRLSITMEAAFCTETLEDALARYGKPDVFNTDQGSQFTGAAFTGVLARNGIPISMDGKGAWRDNVFVERLWRSVKYEEVYLRAYESVGTARALLGRYLDFYNSRRPHSSLDGMTPDQAYFTPLPLRLAA